MAERIDLTQAIPTTTLWRVQSLTLSRGMANVDSVTSDPSASRVTVNLVGDNGRSFSYTWFGVGADADIVSLNKVNLTSNSLEKRILSRLISDGIIAGSISGSPD